MITWVWLLILQRNGWKHLPPNPYPNYENIKVVDDSEGMGSTRTLTKSLVFQ